MALCKFFFSNSLTAPLYLPRDEDAFTLVELISVVGIVAILAAIAIPSYAASISKMRISRAIAELHMLDQEIFVYKTDKGSLPNSLSEIGQMQLNDPWGGPYQYLKIEGSNIHGVGRLRRDRFLNPLDTDYDLYSMGPDGASKPNLNARESLDDVVRVSNGGFIGLATDF